MVASNISYLPPVPQKRILIDDDGDGFTYVATSNVATLSIAIPDSVRAYAKRYVGQLTLLATAAGDVNLLPNSLGTDCSFNQHASHWAAILTGNGLRLMQGANMNLVISNWTIDAALVAGGRSFYAEGRSAQTLPAVNFSATFQGICSMAAEMTSFLFTVNSGGLSLLTGTTVKIWAET